MYNELQNHKNLFLFCHEHAALEWKSLNTLTRRNMSTAPNADPICVMIPHQSRAFLPLRRSVVAMLTLENIVKAACRTDDKI